MNFIKKYKSNIKNNLISKFIFRIYQIGLTIAIYLTIKFRKVIINNWLECLIYVIITVPMCIIWTMLLHDYDSTPPWFFWEHTLICNGIPVNILGTQLVVEDILFYTFGQILGFIFYKKFLDKEYSGKLYNVINNQWIKFGFIILFASFFMYVGMFFDYISFLNLIFWAGPAVIMWAFLIEHIDLYKFLKYSVIMGLIVYIYDFSQVVLLPELMDFLNVSNFDAYGLWIYKYEGIFSNAYSKSFWFWNREPIAMVLFFPYTGMLFQGGLMCLLKRLIQKK